MIRRFALAAFLPALMALGAVSISAATYKLTDGNDLEGEPISFDARGVVVKKADGSFAPRVGWTNLTQEALKELSKQPKAKVFVEPFLDAEEPDAEKKPKLEITPKVHPRLDRPDPRAGLGSLFSSS